MFFSTDGPFRDGLARQISAPLASADGESTGDPSVASLALALAPWPARRALKVEKIESVSLDAPPSPRCRAGDVKPALRWTHRRKKNGQSIQYIFPMKRDLLREIISFSSRKFSFAPRSRKTRGAGYTSVREEGSAHDSARARCRISVVVESKVPDGWMMMMLMQV